MEQEVLTKEHKDVIRKARVDLHALLNFPTGIPAWSEDYQIILEILEALEGMLGY